MKNLLILFLLIAFNSQAQTDTASSPITVVLPVKAVVLYSYYLSQSPTWSERKAPDLIVGLIGSGTQPDSLVTVTMAASKLANLAVNLMGDRYGTLSALNRSVFNNSPAITGYTPLTTQISTKAGTNNSQTAAAIYVINKYNQYLQTMTDLYNQMYSAGLSWIRN